MKRVIVGLSGGVDSSVVSYCLASMSDTKIDTFSIGFEKATFEHGVVNVWVIPVGKQFARFNTTFVIDGNM